MPTSVWSVTPQAAKIPYKYMEQVKQDLAEFKKRLEALLGSLHLDTKKVRCALLEEETLKADFWKDNLNAKKTMQEIDGIKDEIEIVEDLTQRIENAISISSEDALESELQTEALFIKKKLEQLEIRTFLSGRYDKNNAILSVHSGQGGTEAMDWAQMLSRMYYRYAERQNFKVELLDQIMGEEAGIKSATLLITARFAYGYLKNEAGTHRLVRQSPFNADNLRQTSFALVEVLPEITDEVDIEIKDEDLDWQFYRSGGAGGQNVNKVSTAVRLTHIPSGIVVTAQQERFQEKNREIALNLLRAKLWIKKEEETQKKVKEIKGEYRPAAWGTQIRSYVLHPYKMVKDLRTEVETSNTEGVLDGDIDMFIEAELKSK